MIYEIIQKDGTCHTMFNIFTAINVYRMIATVYEERPKIKIRFK